MNLAEIALRPGQDPARANHPAFLTAAGPVTNRAFQKMVAVLAADLAGLGLKPGDKIVFRMTNTVEFAAAFLACIWIGAVPVLREIKSKDSIATSGCSFSQVVSKSCARFLSCKSPTQATRLFSASAGGSGGSSIWK